MVECKETLTALLPIKVSVTAPPPVIPITIKSAATAFAKSLMPPVSTLYSLKVSISISPK